MNPKLKGRRLRSARWVRWSKTVQQDLSTSEGVDRLYEASQRIGRPVDALLANAGRGWSASRIRTSSRRNG